MGCDGGTIPKRDELVRTKKKAEQKDKVSQLNFLWQHCSISQSPLRQPIVACGLGKLYNKDSVIMGILDKSAMTEGAKHIKNMKEVKELNFTPNPAYTGEARRGDSTADQLEAPYICPVLGLEMNGRFKFCFYWSCGCVFSERALKSLKPANCHKCQKSVQESEIVTLNATDEDLEVNRVRMEARAELLRQEKKAKKMAKMIKEEPIPSESEEAQLPPATSTIPTSILPAATIKTEEPETSTGIGIKLKAKNPTVGVNGAQKRTANSLGMQTKDYKKTKGDYSIAADPGASTVLKSLFTSSGAAKNQTKAHWVTYNPFYN